MKFSIKIFSVFLIVSACFAGCQQQQSADTKSGSENTDLQKIRSKIEALDKQFSKDFYNGDSVALADYFSNDAKFSS
ncbi:MAG: hypothetical protein WAM24_04800 [Ignavibacteriaceae bacterium]